MNKNTNLNNFTEINSEYVYLTIPIEYVCVYHKLLKYMADYGKTIIDDCSAICKGNGKNILTCWNLFQSAIACHKLGREKESKLFIDYIRKQLEYIYRGTDKIIHSSSIPINVNDNGKLEAIVGCNDKINFYVDVETGDLYQNNIDDLEYNIDNNNLVIK